MGNRAAAEANLAYFENHAIPDSAVLVSGGQLNNNSVERIENAFKQNKGATKHHKTVILQATSAKGNPKDASSVPTIEWINLSDFQSGDALFQDYTENNQNGLSSSFRQPAILVGRIPTDLNRATALAALSQTEKQVYGPLRRKFDEWVNRKLFLEMGITTVKFTSLSPEATNIEEMAKAAETGIKGGAFSPNILLTLFSQWFNMEFEQIEEPWGNVPLAMTLSGVNPDGSEMDEEELEIRNRKMREFESRVGALETDNLKVFGFDGKPISGE
jgi:capsid portal protein